MQDPLRYWRTGAVAVVMAALGQAAGASSRGAAEERMLVRRQSPYNVAETVLRIEGSARQHGMAVFARIEQGARSSATWAKLDATQVLVLESSQGGTPVLMGGAAVEMELPLSVCVRVGGDGRAEVLMGTRDDWAAMPQALVRDLAELTQIVGDALQA